MPSAIGMDYYKIPVMNYDFNGYPLSRSDADQAVTVRWYLRLITDCATE